MAFFQDFPVLENAIIKFQDFPSSGTGLRFSRTRTNPVNLKQSSYKISSQCSRCFLSFSRQKSKKRASEGAHLGSAQKLGRCGEGVGRGWGEKGFPSLASPPPYAPYFSHFLPVSFPSRKFLETTATQATK